MNRSMLKVWIGRWVVAAAASASLAGCPFAFGDCPIQRDVIVDGGPIDGEFTSDGSIRCGAACARLFVPFGEGIGPVVESCRVLQNDAGGQVLECVGTTPCTGRAPATLVSSGEPIGDDLVGRHFARMAHLEEASIAAF